MITNHIAILVLAAALLCCLYLLTVLARLRHIHHLSRAWRFIFLGLSLLTLECAIGVHLAYMRDTVLTPEESLFLLIIFVKSLCYAIGFTIWKHDLGFYNARHKETLTMEDQKPQHPTPDDPHPPATPPGQPSEPTPQDDDPGVPEGPGKSDQTHP